MTWQSKSEGEALLSLLAQGCEPDQGARLFGSSWFLSPQDACPERWTPTIPALGALLHRLLHCVGLREYQVEIVDARDPLAEGSPLEVPVIEFVALEGGKAVFQVERFGLEEAIIASSCLEVSKAFVASSKTRSPYRGAPDEGALSQREEKLGTAMAIVLGFGVLTTNAASSYHAVAEIHGYSTTTHRAQLSLGALPAADVCFLLAVVLNLRKEENPKKITSLLHTNQADEVDHWVQELTTSHTALLERLKLAYQPRESLQPVTIPPLSAELALRWEEQEQQYRKPNQGISVATFRESRIGSYLFVGLLLGIIPALCLALVVGKASTSLLPFVFAATGIAGTAYGWRHPVFSCSACGSVARGESLECVKCGGLLDKSDSARARLQEALDDEDDDDNPLVQDALAAGQQQSFGDDGAV